MRLQVNNWCQNKKISTFMKENIFAEAVIGFYLCYPKRQKSNRIIFGSFFKHRMMAAVFEVSYSEPPLFLLVDLPNYDTFAQVLIISNGFDVIFKLLTILNIFDYLYLVNFIFVYLKSPRLARHVHVPN